MQEMPEMTMEEIDDLRVERLTKLAERLRECAHVRVDRTKEINHLGRIGTVESKLSANDMAEMGFNMSFFFAIPTDDAQELYSCNTAGCIAGHAVAMFGDWRQSMEIDEEAKALLFLSDQEADTLFVPDMDLMDVTPEEAALAVERIRSRFKPTTVNIWGDPDYDYYEEEELY